jgi:hypothetical protein
MVGRTPGNALLPGESLINQIFANYIDRSIKKKQEFNLTKENFKDFILQNCHYCGKVPSQYISYKTKNRYSLLYNGIDRKNSEEGYTLTNCVTCCKICNYGKRDLSYSEFIEHLTNLVNYRGQL